MNGSERVPVSAGIELVALLLIVGGVLGVGLTFWLDISLISDGRASIFSLSMAITGVFIVVFGWAAWTGRELWRGKRYAITMAQILFALQIPAFQIPGFIYEFHTGFTATLGVAGGSRLIYGFQLGSSVTFYFSRQIQEFGFSVNLAAVCVLVYLLIKAKDLSSRVPPPIAPMPPMQMQ